LASSEHHRTQQQLLPHQSASPQGSAADTDPQQDLSSTVAADSSSSSSFSPREMAATKAELLLSALQISEPLFGHPPPLSPLDGYPKLEELQMLLQNAASAAEAAGLLGWEPSEFAGEQRMGEKVQ
ncbi:hypothetical protein GOODEAATRI_033917, partial [Goodea atripinnis]